MIECITYLGQKKLIPREKLSFRPSAYAIIAHQGKVLLLHSHLTNTYELPGGGVEIGEKIEVCRDDQVDDHASEKPRWIEIKGLKEASFHNPGRLILDALKETQ